MTERITIDRRVKNGALDSGNMTEETLQAIRDSKTELGDLQMRVIKIDKGNTKIEFMNQALSAELQRQKMDVYGDILLKKQINDAQKNAMISQIVSENPTAIGIILDSLIFNDRKIGTRAQKGEVIYTPNKQNIMALEVLLAKELRDQGILEMRKDESGVMKINFDGFGDSEKKLKFVEAYRNAMRKLIMNKYGVDQKYADLLSDSLTNYYGGLNESAGSIKSMSFVVKDQNPEQYTSLVGTALRGELSGDSKFGAIGKSEYKLFSTDPENGIKAIIADKGLIPGAYQQLTQKVAEGLGAVIGHREEGEPLGSGQFTTEQTRMVQNLVAWGIPSFLALRYGKKLLALQAIKNNPDSDEAAKKKAEKDIKTILKRIAVVGGTIGVIGAGVAYWQMPTTTKSMGEALFGPSNPNVVRETNVIDSKQLLAKLSNGEGVNSYSIQEFEKFFNSNVEYAGYSYTPGTFNMPAFIEDFRNKIGNNPTQEQKKILDELVTLSNKKSPTGLSDDIKSGFSDLGVSILKQENGSYKLEGSIAQNNLNTSLEKDEKSHEYVRTQIKSVLETISQNATTTNYQPDSTESRKFMSFNQKVNDLIFMLSQYENGNVDPKTNIFAEQTNYDQNGKFKKGVILAHFQENWNPRERNQLMNALNPYLTESRDANIPFTPATQPTQKAA